jgi:biotin-(acetyl-CoA carboxylase) ligase
MKKLTGSVFNLDKVLRVFQKEIKTYFEILKHEEYELLKNEYERHLFQQKKKSQFKMPSGTVMTGIIEGVNEQGELIIRDHDGIKTSYGFKELELIY